MLKGKKVVILGSGPVGRIAAIIAAKLNCKTYLVETWERSSEEFIKNLAKDLMEEILLYLTMLVKKYFLYFCPN